MNNTYRQPYFLFILSIILTSLHIWFNVYTILPTLWQNSIHFAGFVLVAAILYPSYKLIDIVLGISVVLSATYMCAMETPIYEKGLSLSLYEWIAGSILIICAIEFTRRVAGWIIPIIIIVALSYVTFWGKYVPGVFQFTGLTPETILFRSIYSDDGMFGSIASISSTYIFMFILFGSFLIRSGAGDFIIDLSRIVAGRLIGGPGLVSVIASGLMGTISGSAVANTASTGVITIPLMKRAGFPAKFAGGVEAAASTGGQLMPPIMGAGAFVMATYIQIPYYTIVLVSILPAILYFATVGFFVRIEAKRNNIIPAIEDNVNAKYIIKTGAFVFIAPVITLIGLLIYGFTPTYAAGISILAIIVSSQFTNNKMGLSQIFLAMVDCIQNAVSTAILLCTVGLLVNVISTSGIGNIFSLMISTWAGHNLLLAILLIAIASLILGMGLPVTAAYIILGTLSAPALHGLIANNLLIDALTTGQITESAKAIFMIAIPDQFAIIGQPMSINTAKEIVSAIPSDMIGMVREAVLSVRDLTYSLLSAHLIIFWLSQDSNVTPPVSLAAFTGAAIAKTNPIETGFQAWKLAKGLYIIPLLFAYTPFIGGSLIDDLTIFFFAFFGLYAIAATLEGFMENRLSIPIRIATFGAGLLLLLPNPISIHIVGLIILTLIFCQNIKKC